VTGLLGAFAEAWGEVRVHKSRVLLSLVGVFIAVLAMTSVTAIGQIVAQVQQEQSERYGGRPATLSVNAYDPMTGQSPDPAALSKAVGELVDRYGITTAASITYSEGLYRLPGGTQPVPTTLVSPSYGPLHRIQPVEGRWFAESDRSNFSPALVVNEAFLQMIGASDLSSHPTVVIGGERPIRATVVGVVREGYESEPIVYRVDRSALSDGAAAPVDPMYGYGGPPTTELWVPSDQAEAVAAAVRNDLTLALPGFQADAYRTDPEGQEDFLSTFRLVIRGAGVLVLFLGGLGVLNVGLVTVRQRIREIGVRRSFGATSSRVFAAVMLESVVATALAGVAAVALSVAIVRNLPLEEWLTDGIPLAEAPGFPVAAAVEGLIAATAVGALAGLLPAIIAVRAKVIDAIRF